MRLFGDFDKILEDCFIEDLNWLKEEFDYLFRFKRERFSKNDIKLAKQIIDYMIKNYSGNINERLGDLLTDVLETLEHFYPGLIYNK